MSLPPSLAALKSKTSLAAVRFKHWWMRPAAAIDHRAVMAHLSEEGSISTAYAVLTMLSCGIAILGLLLSSPAVVIGAMLISPLMMPILLFGFSLTTLDHRLLIKSLKAIALGTGLAVAQAAVIVLLSPLTTATPEILARTRPNFFDLLVAVFSAIAGSYAVAHRKGETIVGVAIATALMPPLAVVGYGLAVANWTIFAGAAGLFMTNLLAIGLTASLMARFFGFGAAHPPDTVRRHTLAIFFVFAVLSIPLGFSLHQIAREAVLTSKARATLTQFFAPEGDHLYGMEIRFPKDRPIEIDALVLTHKNRTGAETAVRHRLQNELGHEVTLSLSQVPMEARESLNRQTVEDLIGESAAKLSRRMEATPDVAAIAAAEAEVPPTEVSIDKTAKTAVIRNEQPTPENLAAQRTAEKTLSQRFPDWHFVFRTDMDALPPIPFANGKTDLDEPGKALLDDIAWALKNAGISRVRTIGQTELGKGAAAGRRVARKRARAVAERLKEAGIEATPSARYPAPKQRQMEAELGRAAFRLVLIETAD